MVIFFSLFSSAVAAWLSSFKQVFCVVKNIREENLKIVRNYYLSDNNIYIFFSYSSRSDGSLCLDSRKARMILLTFLTKRERESDRTRKESISSWIPAAYSVY